MTSVSVSVPRLLPLDFNEDSFVTKLRRHISFAQDGKSPVFGPQFVREGNEGLIQVDRVRPWSNLPANGDVHAEFVHGRSFGE